MKAYLLIAKTASEVTKERYETFLKTYRKLFEEGVLDESKYYNFVNCLTRAYDFCQKGNYEQEVDALGEHLIDEGLLELAQRFFVIEKVARLQVGDFNIDCGYYVEYAEDVIVRMGILAETRGDLEKASNYYQQVMSLTINQRGYDLQKQGK